MFSPLLSFFVATIFFSGIVNVSAQAPKNPYNKGVPVNSQPFYPVLENEIVAVKPMHHMVDGRPLKPLVPGGKGHKSGHPHIASGHNSKGRVMVTPITHSTRPELHPMMPLPPGVAPGITGNALLTPITVHPRHVDPWGSGGLIANPAALKPVYDAKHLVEQMRDAAKDHERVHEANMDFWHHHNQQYQQSTSQGNGQAAAYHLERSQVHLAEANKHKDSADSIRTAIRHVNGPDPDKLIQAERSAEFTGKANDALASANSHMRASNFYRQEGHVATAQGHNARVDERLSAARQYTAHSVYHTDHLTGNNI